MERDVSSAAGITAANLRVDAVTAEVLRAFEVAGVQSVLLKGPSVTRWISPPGDPRPYGDCDLLVRPADLYAAEDALRDLGFRPLVDEREMPDWWHEHAVSWVRSRDGVAVDLHRTLLGVGVDQAELWLALSGYVDELVVAGHRTRILTIPGMAFHMALHAAQDGARPLPELDRALAAADEATWRAAADLAVALQATEAFAAGLRLSGEGRVVADRLGLPGGLPTGVALRATSPPPVALGLEQLVQADGLRSRLMILRYKLVPPPTFMRHWSPRAREGRLGLTVAYLWRPLWLLARLPAGLMAWRRARRLAERSGSNSS